MSLCKLNKQEIAKLEKIAKVAKLLLTQANYLEQQLCKFKHEYYNNSVSLISDELYDALEKKLAHYLASKSKLHQDSSKLTSNVFVNKFKVVEQVGAEVSDKFTKIQHSLPMLSLDNAFNENEVQDFDSKIKKFLNPVKNLTAKDNNVLTSNNQVKSNNQSESNNQAIGSNNQVESNRGLKQITYHAEPKMDGLSLSILYLQGKFIRAVTRGNGLIGEDVTLNAKGIKNIPQNLQGKYPQLLEVRGEVFISKEHFKLLNQKQSENKAKIFATARNVASGSLRLLDANASKERYLEFSPWGLGKFEPENLFYSMADIFNNLQSFGFTVNPHNQVCHGVDELLQHYHYLENKRAELPYEIDGVVYKVNELALQARLGILIKSPRWAIAHKFVATKVQTKVKDIIVQIGRSGVLTPVAELEPIGIAGVIVSRVTLHNLDEIKRKDIQIGDIVELYRAGDVIPKISQVIVEKRVKATKFVMPQVCPYCGSKLEQIKGEVAVRCSASVWFCLGRCLENFKHFVSKNAMNIEGLSEQTIKFLLDNNYIVEYADIYQLQQHQAQLIKTKGFGEQSIKKLLNSIESSKKVNLANFIFALGIPQIGFKHANTLAKYYKSIENIISTFKNINPQENLVEQINIQFFGESIIASLYNYFKDTAQQEVLNNLLAKLKILNYTHEVLQSNLFTDKKILFSGTLQTMSRLEAQALATKYGAYIVSSISKKLNYLIVGEKAGSKLKKAQALDIAILSEVEFLNLIQQDKASLLDANNDNESE